MNSIFSHFSLRILVLAVYTAMALVSGPVRADVQARERSLSFDSFSEIASELQRSHGSHRTLDDEFARKHLNTVSEAGKTLVVTLLLTGLESTRQVLYSSGLTAKAATSKELKAAVSSATGNLINNGELWLGLVGSEALGGVLEKPVQALGAVLAQGEARQLLGQLVASGILSFVAYFGTEMGRELWHEARERIHHRADYQRAGRLFETSWGALLSKIGNNPVKYRDDRRVLGLLLQNAAQILFQDPELRNAWFYNAWRLRIATGDFVSMVMAMTAATFVGSLVPTPFPGAGLLVGAMFGAAGGVAAMLLPQSVKDVMTDDIRLTRAGFNVGRLGTNLQELREVLQILDLNTPLMIARNENEPGMLNGLHATLKRRRELRDLVLTARWELAFVLASRIHGLRQTLKRLEEEEKLSHSAKTVIVTPEGAVPIVKHEDLQAALHGGMLGLGNVLDDLGKFYAHEDATLAKAERRWRGLVDAARGVLAAERKALRAHGRLFDRLIPAVQEAVLKDDGVSRSSDPGALALLQTFYFKSYGEERLREVFSRIQE